jgi:RNA polymerase sigma factor for flagellar operon FliA
MLEPAARDKLIEEHLGYVRALARQVQKEIAAGRTIDFDELVAFGSGGLVEAAERWDPSRGVAFTTFAHYRIRGAILDGLRQSGWRPRTYAARFAVGAHDYLENISGRTRPPQARPEPIEETSADLGHALEDLAAVFIVSLSGPLEDRIADRAPSASEELEREQTSAGVKAAVQRLPEKERQLVELYYFQGLTLEDAGRKLGLSKSWSSRLHARAMHALAHALAS